jgi:hypothetical protein
MGRSSQTFAARAAIQHAAPTAAKNIAAIQAWGSDSLFATIATAIVVAATPHKKANAMQQR